VGRRAAHLAHCAYVACRFGAEGDEVTKALEARVPEASKEDGEELTEQRTQSEELEDELQALKTQFERDPAAKEEAGEEKWRVMGKQLRDREAELDEERMQELVNAREDLLISHKEVEVEVQELATSAAALDVTVEVEGEESVLADMEDEQEAAIGQRGLATSEEKELKGEEKAELGGAPARGPAVSQDGVTASTEEEERSPAAALDAKEGVPAADKGDKHAKKDEALPYAALGLGDTVLPAYKAEDEEEEDTGLGDLSKEEDGVTASIEEEERSPAAALNEGMPAADDGDKHAKKDEALHYAALDLGDTVLSAYKAEDEEASKEGGEAAVDAESLPGATVAANRAERRRKKKERRELKEQVEPELPTKPVLVTEPELPAKPEPPSEPELPTKTRLRGEAIGHGARFPAGSEGYRRLFWATSFETAEDGGGGQARAGLKGYVPCPPPAQSAWELKEIKLKELKESVEAGLSRRRRVIEEEMAAFSTFYERPVQPGTKPLSLPARSVPAT
jgi:hypothetical protein